MLSCFGRKMSGLNQLNLFQEKQLLLYVWTWKQAHHSKWHNEQIELPFIVKQPISGFIIQCKLSQGKSEDNEWTHLQICHRLCKCQIRPNLSCLDEWQALGRVSLCLLSFPPIKKSDTPGEMESARLITELLLYPEKNWALRSLWQTSCGILWCGFRLTLCKEPLTSLRITYSKECNMVPYAKALLQDLFVSIQRHVSVPVCCFSNHFLSSG